MRIRNNTLIVLITILIGVGLTSFRDNNCINEGTILNFNSLKCGGCWGWTIKIGSDTIKTDNLPYSQNITQQLKFPQKVKVGIGQRKVNQYSIDYEYYEITCIELVTDPKCSEIVWYRFIGGKPDMNYVRTSENVAKKWGFTIEYEFGSCGNTEYDKRKYEECEMKSKETLTCLAEKYGDDWQSKFFKQVEKEK